MIKTSDILKKVGEIAKSNPDITYPHRMMDMGAEEVENLPCLYTYNGQPACIMGMALNELGVSIETLEDFDVAGETIRVVIRDNPSLIEDDGHALKLYSIQKLQDVGYTFEKAFSNSTE